MDINDRDTLIRLLDQAMSSKEQTVKDLLQSLLVTVSLVHADDKAPPGPLSDILDTFYDVQEKVNHLQNTCDGLTSRVRALEADAKKSVQAKHPYVNQYNSYIQDDLWNFKKKNHKNKLDYSSDNYESDYNGILKSLVESMSKQKSR